MSRSIGTRAKQNGRDVIWSGDNYGWQSPATHNKLKNEGKLKFGAQQLDRISQSLSRIIPEPVKQYAAGVQRTAAKTAEEDRRIREQHPVGRIQNRLQSKPSATERVLQGTSDKLNVDRRIVDTTAAVAQAAIEAKVGLDAIRLSPRGQTASASRISTRLQGRSVGAAATPSGKVPKPVTQFSDDAAATINARLRANSKRTDLTPKTPPTPKTAGKASMSPEVEGRVAKAIQARKDGRYVVRGEHRNEVVNTARQAEVETRMPEYQSTQRARDVAERSRFTSSVEGGRVKVTEVSGSDRPQQRSIANLDGKRPLPVRRVDGEVTSTGRIRSATERSRASRAAQAQNRAAAKSDIARQPSRKPVTPIDQLKEGSIPSKNSSRRIKRRMQELLSSGKLSGKNQADRALSQAVRESIQDNINRNGITPSNLDNFEPFTDPIFERIKREKGEAAAEAYLDRVAARRANFESLYARRQGQRMFRHDGAVSQHNGDLIPDEFDQARLNRGGRKGVRREMTPEAEDRQTERTATDLSNNSLRREATTGGTRVKTLPGRDPRQSANQVVQSVVDDLNRQTRGKASEWIQANPALFDKRVAERLGQPEASIKWHNRFTKQDPVTSGRVPTDEIPNRIKSRLRERTNKNAKPTRAEVAKRKELDNAGELISDLSRPTGSKTPLKEVNRRFAETINLAGKLEVRNGELKLKRIRSRVGSPGRQTGSKANFDLDSFHYKDLDQPGRELNQRIRDRLRTLDYEKFFEERYPRSKYPASMSAEQVHRERVADFAREFPSDARILGGNLKTDNAPGRRSVSNQFAETRERLGQGGRIEQATQRLRERGFNGRSTFPQGRTVPIGKTVLDRGQGLNQTKPEGRIRRRLTQNPQRLQEAQQRTQVKLDRVRRQIEKRLNRNR